MSSEEYFVASGTPSTRSQSSSSAMRAELQAIADAFDNLPDLAGNASYLVSVKANETGLEASIIRVDKVVRVDIANLFQKSIYESSVNLSGTAIDPTAGALFCKTLSGDATLTIGSVAGISGVVSFSLEIDNGGTERVVTWPASVVWADGATPSPTAAIDVYSFYTRDQGVTWRGVLTMSFVA